MLINIECDDGFHLQMFISNDSTAKDIIEDVLKMRVLQNDHFSNNSSQNNEQFYVLAQIGDQTPDILISSHVKLAELKSAYPSRRVNVKICGFNRQSIHARFQHSVNDIMSIFQQITSNSSQHPSILPASRPQSLISLSAIELDSSHPCFSYQSQPFPPLIPLQITPQSPKATTITPFQPLTSTNATTTSSSSHVHNTVTLPLSQPIPTIDTSSNISSTSIQPRSRSNTATSTQSNRSSITRSRSGSTASTRSTIQAPVAAISSTIPIEPLANIDQQPSHLTTSASSHPPKPILLPVVEVLSKATASSVDDIYSHDMNEPTQPMISMKENIDDSSDSKSTASSSDDSSSSSDSSSDEDSDVDAGTEKPKQVASSKPAVTTEPQAIAQPSTSPPAKNEDHPAALSSPEKRPVKPHAGKANSDTSSDSGSDDDSSGSSSSISSDGSSGSESESESGSDSDSESSSSSDDSSDDEYDSPAKKKEAISNNIRQKTNSLLMKTAPTALKNLLISPVANMSAPSTSNQRPKQPSKLVVQTKQKQLQAEKNHTKLKQVESAPITSTVTGLPTDSAVAAVTNPMKPQRRGRPPAVAALTAIGTESNTKQAAANVANNAGNGVSHLLRKAIASNAKNIATGRQPVKRKNMAEVNDRSSPANGNSPVRHNQSPPSKKTKLDAAA